MTVEGIVFLFAVFGIIGLAYAFGRQDGAQSERFKNRYRGGRR